MRLERLPLDLTAGNDLQSYRSISEKKWSDYTAGKDDVFVLSDNLLHENSPKLHGESMDLNGKATENNFCSKIRNLKRPIQTNRTPETSCNQKRVKSSLTIEKPFKCNSTKVHNLKRHAQAKHTLEGPFKCNECDYSAKCKSYLKCHIQAKHTLEKPFKCNECDYSSAQASNLKRHVQTMHTL